MLSLKFLKEDVEPDNPEKFFIKLFIVLSKLDNPPIAPEEEVFRFSRLLTKLSIPNIFVLLTFHSQLIVLFFL